MVSPVSASASLYANAPVATGTKVSTGANSQAPPGVQDKVDLSSKAKAQLNNLSSALQEASETPAQTANEARHGDLQAKKLLAREEQAQQNSIAARK